MMNFKIWSVRMPLSQICGYLNFIRPRRRKITRPTPFLLLIILAADLFCFALFATGHICFAAQDFKIPPNQSSVQLPANIDVCLIDNFKTAEISVSGTFSLKAFDGQGRQKLNLQSDNLRLYVERITRSKPAVVKYYAVLKTFPYSYLQREDKKKDALDAIAALENLFGKPVFFTYGCILKPARADFSIDVRTLFAARGPFETEEQCRKFCDDARARHKTPAFAHPVREKKSVCEFDLLISHADQKNVKNNRLKNISRVEVVPDGPAVIKNMEFGRGDKWHNFKDAKYAGTLKISADNSGLIQIVNNISFEELLKVVVPSEIEPDSAYQAVCAQAVAARSEVLAKYRTRHTESDYDFCSATHCQAYGGINNRRKQSDRAVDETAGKIVFSNGHIVDTVYHANCGGLTEDSNRIWSAPFDPALVKITDSTAETAIDLSTDETAVKKFIAGAPASYCSVPGACNNPDKYRWTREFSRSEMERLIKKQFDIGTLKSIEVLERGASGRVVAIAIHGSRATEKVYKELPIRKLFAMLRSSLFILELHPGNAGGEDRFLFKGAGWGHGVGLCQDGAKGMAILGKNYEQILLHYYSNSKIISFD